MKEKIITYIRERFGVEPEHPWKKYPAYATFKTKENDKWFAVLMEVGADKILNVKASEEFIAIMAGKDGFLPAYHMNKKHWLTLLLDGSLPFSQIAGCLDTSYAIVADSPTLRIYEAVKRIPRGKVATYGDVAEMAGDRKMARAVGNALHKNPDPDHVPCYRVVNAKGELAGEYVFGGAWEQAKLLEADGIEVKDGAVDLAKYRMDLS